MIETASSDPPMPRGARTGAEGEGALEAVFLEHQEAVHAYVSRRVGDHGTVDDITAQVFAIAFRRREELPRRPRGWLLGVARRVLANHFRAEQRRTALVDRLATSAGAASPEDSQQRLGPALAELSEDDQEVLLLRYWDELTAAELAQALDCSVPAVYVRLHRARGRLAQGLSSSDSKKASS